MNLLAGYLAIIGWLSWIYGWSHPMNLLAGYLAIIGWLNWDLGLEPSDESAGWLSGHHRMAQLGFRVGAIR